MDRRRVFLLPLVAALPLVLAAATSSCGATVVFADCNDGERECNGECVVVSSDPSNCGACGVECPEGVCESGQCTTGGCKPPTVDCGGTCVDTSLDPNHCGACFSPCDDGVCNNGQCAEECPPNLTNCFGSCVDTTSDGNNCGFCGNQCGDEQGCISGNCVGNPCEEPFELCNGECVDTQFDDENCSFCGNGCPGFQTCEFGQCIGGACDDAVCNICDVVFLPSDLIFQATGTTEFSGNDHIPICTGASAPEVLHVFTAPATGVYTFDTIRSSYDTALVLMDESCSTLDCSDDEIGAAAQIQAPLEAGRTVYLVVDGFDSGPYALNVNFVGDCPPGTTQCGGDCVDTSNDPSNCGGCGIPCAIGAACNFGECEMLCNGPCGTCEPTVFLPSSVPQSTVGSTLGLESALSPSCGDGTAGEKLHFFQAPFAGTFVFSTGTSEFDTVLTLLDPATCGELACNDDASSPTSLVSMVMTQGQGVYVLVDGANGESGTYTLTVAGSSQPACPTVAMANTVPQTVSGTTAGSLNARAGTCGGGSAPDNTFAFTAPTTKTYVIDTIGSSFDTVLYVLNGTCTGTQELGCNDDVPGLGSVSQLSVPLTAGQAVTIVVDGWGQHAGNYQLRIQ
ncbi:MAG: hypothetical protein HOW73_37195 [Polyangiaceae bacterium]|nr:hypothetical protein [Polyangiaceae bacterium]